jgi:hypothetical protein
VLISQSGPNAFFFIGGSRFSIKLVDAQFPPYAQVIPQTTERAIRVPRAAFAEALSTESAPDTDSIRSAELAYHWYAAHNLPRAFEASIRAGLAADAMYALADARANYERA